MLHQGVTPLTVFPQHFPECLLSLFSVNVRNHSLLLAPDGWLRPGKGMRETLPRLSLPLPPPPGPLVTWPVSAHPMMAHHWSRRLGEMLAAAWEELGTPLSQFKPEITNSYILIFIQTRK